MIDPVLERLRRMNRSDLESEIEHLRAENVRLRQGIEAIKHDLEWAMPDDMLDIQAGNIQEVIDDAGKLLATHAHGGKLPEEEAT